MKQIRVITSSIIGSIILFIPALISGCHTLQSEVMTISPQEVRISESNTGRITGSVVDLELEPAPEKLNVDAYNSFTMKSRTL